MKRQYVQWYASATQCEPYNVQKSIFITKMLWNDTGKLDLNKFMHKSIFPSYDGSVTGFPKLSFINK